MSENLARALWLCPPNQAEIRSETLPNRRDDELLLRTRYSAISRGTETLVYRGEVPPSEYARMQAPFQAGSLPGPVKHGYANVARVEDGPAEWRGRDVFCLYPHQTRYVVPIDAVIPLSDDVPAQRAVLASNMETAVNGLWDAGIGIGDRISVIGAGVIGALVAGLAARIPGTAVELVDIDPRKAALAEALGVAFRTPNTAARERDCVVHASASAAGLNSAIELAGFEATVLEMSWFGERSVTLDLGGSFHSQRLTIRSSQVGAVSPSRRPRLTHAQRLSIALGLLCDARFDALIETDADFDTLPEVMQRLASSEDNTLCQRIRYPV